MAESKIQTPKSSYFRLSIMVTTGTEAQSTMTCHPKVKTNKYCADSKYRTLVRLQILVRLIKMSIMVTELGKEADSR